MSQEKIEAIKKILDREVPFSKQTNRYCKMVEQKELCHRYYRLLGCPEDCNLCLAQEICQLFEPKPDASRFLTNEDLLDKFGVALNEYIINRDERLRVVAKAQDTQTASIIEKKCQDRVEKIYALLNNNFDEVADLFAGYDNKAQRQIRESFSGFGKLISSWLREKALKKQEGIDD